MIIKFLEKNYRVAASKGGFSWMIGIGHDDLLVAEPAPDLRSFHVKNGAGDVLGYISPLTKEQLFAPEVQNA